MKQNAKRLIVYLSRGQYVNIAISKIEKYEDVIFAYDSDGTEIAMFDLGCVEAFWISSKNAPEVKQ